MFSDEILLRIIGLMKERAVFLKDIYTQGEFFFQAPKSYDEKGLKKAYGENTGEILTEFIQKLTQVDFQAEPLKELIHDFAKEKELGIGKVMMPLRLALVGELKGPDVPEIMEIIGPEETIERIQRLIEKQSQ